MKSIERRLRAIGAAIPDILLPAPEVDPKKWAVIACDQYTSDPSYWERVAVTVGDAPSTLHVIYPEVYLGEHGGDVRIDSIHAAMRSYLEKGILIEAGPGILTTKRTYGDGTSRRGVLIALDLEAYDFSKGSASLIRATEATILDRLPPRIAIRKRAPLELPHILVLIDDPAETVIEPFAASAEGTLPVYDTDLMSNGGHLTGYLGTEPSAIEGFTAALERLADPRSFLSRYGSGNVLLFAVGDGNHSLATAKSIWERKKGALTESERYAHPARFAMVEIVNIHDPGLKFHGIHRIFGGLDAGRFAELVEERYPAGARRAIPPGRIAEVFDRYEGSGREIGWRTGGDAGLITLDAECGDLPAVEAQRLLSAVVSAFPGAEVDFVHGAESASELGSGPDSAAVFLPPLMKSEFFSTIIKRGILPQKAFSMGEADEKRFYFECRRIVPDGPLKTESRA